MFRHFCLFINVSLFGLDCKLIYSLILYFWTCTYYLQCMDTEGQCGNSFLKKVRHVFFYQDIVSRNIKYCNLFTQVQVHLAWDRRPAVGSAATGISVEVWPLGSPHSSGWWTPALGSLSPSVSVLSQTFSARSSSLFLFSLKHFSFSAISSTMT